MVKMITSKIKKDDNVDGEDESTPPPPPFTPAPQNNKRLFLYKKSKTKLQQLSEMKKENKTKNIFGHSSRCINSNHPSYRKFNQTRYTGQEPNEYAEH